RPDHRAGPFPDQLLDRGNGVGGLRLQEAAGAEVVLDHFLDAPPQVDVLATGPRQEGPAFRLGAQFHGSGKDRFDLVRRGFHGSTTSNGCPLSMRKPPPDWLSQFGKRPAIPFQRPWSLPYSQERA